MKKIIAFGLLMMSVACQTIKNEVSKTIFSPKTFGQIYLDRTENHEMFDSLYVGASENKIKLDKSRLATVEGKLACKSGAEGSSCALRARLPNPPYLAKPRNLSRDLSQKLIAHFNSSDSEFQTEEMILANVQCDLIGEQLPPYKQTNINCHLGNPHRASELVFGDALAKQAFRDLSRGSGDAQMRFSSQKGGTLRCTYLSDKTRRACQIKAKDYLSALSLTSTNQVYEVVGQTLRDGEIYRRDFLDRLRINMVELRLDCEAVRTAAKSGDYFNYICKAHL